MVWPRVDVEGMRVRVRPFDEGDGEEVTAG